jgi:hypothetical protein
MAEFQRWTLFLNGALDVCLLVQLLRCRLARRYCWLFSYLLAGCLQILLALPLSVYSRWYGNIYFGGQAVKAALGVLVAIELWKLALRGYPALARFGRSIVLYMLLAAIAVATVELFLEPATPRGEDPLVHLFLAIEGAVDFMVLSFLVVAVLFLLWFPVKMHRNVAVCMGGFVFYWFQRWTGLGLVNLYPARSILVGTVMSVLSLGCLILWTLALRPEGEIATTVTGHRWNPAETEHLLGQLGAINVRLERMGRREFP